MATIAKIEQFRVYPRWLIVKVETSDGMVGWGESTLEGHTEAVEGSLHDLTERFVGQPCDNIEQIWQSAHRQRFYRFGPVLLSALSGLDIALWDIKGKRLGVPIYDLLGGRLRDRIKVYGPVRGTTPEEIGKEAANRYKQGFRFVKFTPTDGLDWVDSPRKLQTAVEKLKAIQAAGVDAGIDFHGRVHKSMSRQLARALEPYSPFFIEEPLLPGQIESVKQLSQHTTIPIATYHHPYRSWRAIVLALGCQRIL